MKHVLCNGRVYSIEQPSLPTFPPQEPRRLWWCSGCLSTVPDNEVSK